MYLNWSFFIHFFSFIASTRPESVKMVLLRLLSLFLIITLVESTTIVVNKTLTICEDETYDVLYYHYNTDLLELQTKDFGKNMYEAGKTCSIKFSYLTDIFDYYFLIDYIALAASDSLIITDGVNIMWVVTLAFVVLWIRRDLASGKYIFDRISLCVCTEIKFHS